MPVLGEIKRGSGIGKEYYRKYLWDACPKCGKERWVQTRNKGMLCRECFAPKMEDSASWKGGRSHNAQGYILVKLKSDDFFYPMAQCNGYVMEHRLVMAKHLGRCLHRWEIVHHKNHIKDDNGIENLQPMGDNGHKQITILSNKILKLEKRIEYLENKFLPEKLKGDTINE